jgi:hypothetical protein
MPSQSAQQLTSLNIVPGKGGKTGPNSYSLDGMGFFDFQYGWEVFGRDGEYGDDDSGCYITGQIVGPDNYRKIDHSDSSTCPPGDFIMDELPGAGNYRLTVTATTDSGSSVSKSWNFSIGP